MTGCQLYRISLIIGVLKLLVAGKLVDFHQQQLWEVDPLNNIFQETIQKAEKAVIVDKDYLTLFGINQPSITAGELWQHLYALVEKEEGTAITQWKEQLDVIFQNGTLATRILKSLGGIYSEQNIKMIYTELADCLAKNEMYKP